MRRWTMRAHLGRRRRPRGALRAGHRAARSRLRGRRLRECRARRSSAAQRGAPDLVFTDVRMPGDDGLVLLDKLKAAQPQLPVIVMSAYTDVASTAGAFRGGAHEFLSKPFDLDDAVALAARARCRRGARRTAGDATMRLPIRARRSELVGDDAGDARAVPRHRPAGAGAAVGAGHRRNRHRQGTGGARAASRIAARAQAVRRAQHRGDPVRTAGKRTVRPRGRRFHRRAASATSAASNRPTAARCSSTKSATCRCRCRRACCACWPRASSSASAAAN